MGRHRHKGHSRTVFGAGRLWYRQGASLLFSLTSSNCGPWSWESRPSTDVIPAKHQKVFRFVPGLGGFSCHSRAWFSMARSCAPRKGQQKKFRRKDSHRPSVRLFELCDMWRQVEQRVDFDSLNRRGWTLLIVANAATLLWFAAS